MELRQLRYFVFLAEELHFGRAAGRLQISTPTLSQQVAALERSLKQRLVDRSSHGVAALTPAGHALLAEARLVLAAAERARDAVADAGRSSATLNIRVATGLHVVLRQELPALAAHPGLDVNLVLSNGMDAELAVLHGAADAAFVWGKQRQDKALRSVVVATTPVSLAMPPEHRLAALDVVPVGELISEPLVLFPRELSPGVYDRFLQHLLPGITPAPGQLLYERVGIDSSESMLRAVVDQRAVAPYVHVVALEADVERDGRLVLRPLDPPLHLPVELAWRDPPRPQLRALIDQLRVADRAGRDS